MGVIRGILLVLVSVLLLLSCVSTILLGILTTSLDYNNVQKESTILAKDLLSQVNASSIITPYVPLMQQFCLNNSEYVFNSEGYTFTIPCTAVSQGNDAIIGEIMKGLIHKIYYTEYQCEFIECIKQSNIPLFLISEKAYKFLKNKFYLSFGALILLAIGTFFLIKKKSNFPIMGGIFLIISSLPFIKLYSLFEKSNNTLFKFLKIFFSQSYPISIKFLIAGIILIVIGIISKIFKIGFFIEKIISKFSKEKESIKKLEVKGKPKQQVQSKKNKKSK